MPNTNEQRPQSGLCERVISREATETETEGLVYNIFTAMEPSSAKAFNEVE